MPSARRTRCRAGGIAVFAAGLVAATDDGLRSATVSVSSQITPKSDPKRFPPLRKIFGLAVCAALSRP